jgi:positive regulator of sigma E activity
MNSDKSVTINHEGTVQRSTDKSVIVSISTFSACAGCHAENSCSLSGREEKIVEVHGNYSVKPGDRVTVVMKQSIGFTALFFGYLLPLISVILMLILLISLNINELIAGLTSLGMLVPYYFILRLFRNTINEKFTFTLKA